MKNRQATSAAAAGGTPRADESAVWSEVDELLVEVDAEAPTRALADAFVRRRNELDELCGAVTAKPGQTGAVVAISGEFVVLDRVSRPGVFGSLFGPLVQGYALDALGAPAPARQPSLDDARAFVDEVHVAPITERDGIGAGRDVRVAGRTGGRRGIGARKRADSAQRLHRLGRSSSRASGRWSHPAAFAASPPLGGLPESSTPSRRGQDARVGWVMAIARMAQFAAGVAAAVIALT